LQALSARGDPLEAIDHLVPWGSFRAEIEAVVLTPDELKKSSAGRKPFDAILGRAVEYQVRDRLSFSRFLGLAIEDSIPDATTLWLFREKLAKAEMIEKLFDRFDQHLAAKGYWRVAGRSSTPVSCWCRRSGTVHAELQAGRTPAGWKQKPPRCALDQEAWPQLLRLQEPCERGRQAQADPALYGDRCVISALSLRQFCGVSGSDAVAYWIRNTDNNDGPEYDDHKRKIAAFVPYADLTIDTTTQRKICPQL
jgi:Transposase domain (DUF772)